jgi:hypothetical protein
MSEAATLVLKYRYSNELRDATDFFEPTGQLHTGTCSTNVNNENNCAYEI